MKIAHAIVLLSLGFLTMTANAGGKVFHDTWDFDNSTSNFEGFHAADRMRTIKKNNNGNAGGGVGGGLGDSLFATEGSDATAASSDVNQSRNNIWANLGSDATFNLNLYTDQAAKNSRQMTEAKQTENTKNYGY